MSALQELRKRLLTFTLLVSVCGPLYAQDAERGTPIYRCRGDGVLHYTSKPLAGMECMIISYYKAPGGASRWETISVLPNGSTTSIDRTTIKRHGERRTAWIEYRYPLVYAVDVLGKKATKVVSRNEYDCPASTSATEYSIYYDEKENVIHEVSPLTPRHVPAVPDTVGEATLRHLCATE